MLALQVDSSIYGDGPVRVLRYGPGRDSGQLAPFFSFEGREAALVLAFVPPDVDFGDALKGIAAQSGKIPLIAVSTAGELCEDPRSPGDLYVRDKAAGESVVLQAFGPDLIEAVSIHAVPLHNDDIRSGKSKLSRRERVSRIKASLKEVAVPFPIDCRDTLALTFIDGVSSCESYFMEAVYQTGHFPCPFVGGSAGGPLDFSGTRIFDGTQTRENHAVVIFLKLAPGKRYSVLKSQNFTRTHTSFVVMKADPDHRTVSTVVDPESLEVFTGPAALAEAFGCDIEEIGAHLSDHTFGINIEGEIYVRSIAGIDHDAGRMSFYCDVNPGDRLYLLNKLDFAGQTRADYQAFLADKPAPVGGILNDCILRRLNNPSALDRLDDLWHCPVAGFSTFGELHGININETLTGVFFFDVPEGTAYRDEFIDNFPVYYGRFYNYFTACRLNRIELLNRLRTSDLLTDQFAEMAIDSDDVGILAAQACTERALRSSEARLAAITNSLFDGVLLVDRAGSIVFANPAARALLHFDAPLPCHIDDVAKLVVGERAARFVRHLANWSNAGKQSFADPDAMFELANGERCSVSYAIAPTLEETDLNGVVISFRGIDELKLAQKEAQMASRLASVGQLAAGIAHEINTPIQYIGDNLRFVRDSLGGIVTAMDGMKTLLETAAMGNDAKKLLDEHEADYLLDEMPRAVSDSLNGVEQVANIVRSMKEFSHPGTKTKVVMDINRAIGSTLTVSRNEWKHVATVETDLAPDLPEVLCYPADINQVFLNLIVNAAQAIGSVTPERMGVIRISTRLDGDLVEIRIADTGPGVPAAIKDRIFDPFFTTKNVGKGTGQGLSICQNIIGKKHGGMIYLDETVTEGAAFVVRLPIKSEEK